MPQILLTHLVPLLLTLLVGAATIVQGGLNHRWSSPVVDGTTSATSTGWNLISILFLNSIATLVIAGVLWAISFFRKGWLPTALEGSGTVGFPQGVHWFHFFPGLCGMIIIAGIPMSIEKIGVVKTMLLVIAAQLVFGLLWDSMISQQEVSVYKMLGVLITMIGACFTLLVK